MYQRLGPSTRKCQRLLVLIAVLAGLLTLPDVARADEIALWNFNNAIPSMGGFAANRGTGVLTTTATPGTVFFTTDGMSLNSQMGDLPGFSFLIRGGASNANNGSFIDLHVNTAGFNSVMVSFAANRSNGGFNMLTMLVSNNGTTFTNLGDFTVPEVPPNPAPNLGQIYSASFSAAAANNPLFTFRLIINGNTNGDLAGIRFDNVLVSGTPTAVPEPATLFLLGTGLVGAVGAVRRRLRIHLLKNCAR